MVDLSCQAPDVGVALAALPLTLVGHATAIVTGVQMLNGVAVTDDTHFIGALQMDQSE